MNTAEIKKCFTILRNNPNLVYLDSAATTLTPDSVVDAMDEYYHAYNANIARGVYAISERATEAYENVRDKVASFIGATDRAEVIFTSGTTASINMIAFGLMQQLTPKDHIAVTAMEHHANFIPWQRLVTPAQFDTIGITADGHIDMDDFAHKITSNTKILAFASVSNVLGTLNPVKDIIAAARAINPDMITIVDAAQSVAHLPTNVHNLDCDFLVFSGHKLFGPTGTGILWGKKNRLESLLPLFTGGEMIQEVTLTTTTFAQLPHRLEAGTPNIAGIIGLGAAIDYTVKHTLPAIRTHETSLLTYAQTKLQEVFGDDIIIFGPTTPQERSGVLSFAFKNYHPHDIAAILDTEAHICVRAGQHCTMPLHIEFLNTPATVRMSFSLYNDITDIDAFISGLRKVDTILS